MSKAFCTQDKVDRAKALFLDGWSAGAIANEIGAVSRNAVIGKLNRMGLYRQTPAQPDGSRGDPQKRSKGGYPFAVPNRRHGGLRGGNTKAHRPPNVAPKKLKPAFRPVNAGALVAHEDLTRHHCQWPFGETLPYRFCGAAKEGDGPYCAQHTAIARGARFEEPEEAPEERAAAREREEEEEAGLSVYEEVRRARRA